MAGTFISFFKNSLRAGDTFFANSSNVVFGNISINSLGFSINSPSVVVGSNSAIVGNSTVFANLYYSRLNFINGANSAIYSSFRILIDTVTSNAKINTTTVFIETGNNLFGTVTSLRFGNSTVNAQVTTNALFLKDQNTFLQPNGVQIDGGGKINTTTLAINSITTVTPAGAVLTGNASALAVFNSTANGVVLAANNAGTPISTNIHILAGNRTWRKGHVWQQFVNWSTQMWPPPITWPGNTFSTIEVSGTLYPVVFPGSGKSQFRFWFHYNGATRGEAGYFYNIHSIWGMTPPAHLHYIKNGADGYTTGFLTEVEEIGGPANPFRINLKFFNSANARPFCFVDIANFAPEGHVRLFEGWVGHNFPAPVPDANGVTGFQLAFTNLTTHGQFAGNLTITGTPF